MDGRAGGRVGTREDGRPGVRERRDPGRDVGRRHGAGLESAVGAALAQGPGPVLAVRGDPRRPGGFVMRGRLRTSPRAPPACCTFHSVSDGWWTWAGSRRRRGPRRGRRVARCCPPGPADGGRPAPAAARHLPPRATRVRRAARSASPWCVNPTKLEGEGRRAQGRSPTSARSRAGTSRSSSRPRSTTSGSGRPARPSRPASTSSARSAATARCARSRRRWSAPECRWGCCPAAPATCSPATSTCRPTTSTGPWPSPSPGATATSTSAG